MNWFDFALGAIAGGIVTPVIVAAIAELMFRREERKQRQASAGASRSRLTSR